MAGQVLMQQEQNGFAVEFLISDLNTGLYIIEIKTDAGYIRKQFVKE